MDVINDELVFTPEVQHEIEMAILKLSAVKEAVAMLREEKTNDQQ